MLLVGNRLLIFILEFESRLYFGPKYSILRGFRIQNVRMSNMSRGLDHDPELILMLTHKLIGYI